MVVTHWWETGIKYTPPGAMLSKTGPDLWWCRRCLVGGSEIVRKVVLAVAGPDQQPESD